MEESENIKKLGAMIQDVTFAMMTTVNDEGQLCSRPMTTQKATFDGVLWFLVGKSSRISNDIQKNAQINLAYADPGHQRYISVTGMAEVLKDRNKEQELWNPLYQAWFPDGLDDPDLALIKVTVHQAEYWDAIAGRLEGVIRFVKALTMGTRYQKMTGEHKTIQLRH